MGVISATASKARESPHPLRRRVTGELLVLGVMASVFLALFPQRPILVDLGLALFALSLVLLTAPFTRTELWAQWPADTEPTSRGRGLLATLALTLGTIVFFLAIGLSIGYQGADWPGAKARVLHPYIPRALLLYLPWAFLQQMLFQFYLLSRIRTLCPSWHPFAVSTLNGLIFGLVHVPHLWIVLLAAIGGTLWSLLYLQYRQLWPLALSHALIGTTFYYWVYGSDLAGRWMALWRSWSP